MHLVVALAKFNEIDLTIADHPAYSPDLAPWHYYLFSKLKEVFKVDKELGLGTLSTLCSMHRIDELLC
jgi:hypothetical protein